jgi:hypothetical protein
LRDLTGQHKLYSFPSAHGVSNGTMHRGFKQHTHT